MTIDEPRGDSGLVKRLSYGLRQRAFSLGVSSAISLGGLLYPGNVRAEENFFKDPIGYIGGWLDPFIGGPERDERKAKQEKERLEFERKLKQAREGRETTGDEKNYVVEGNVWIDYDGDNAIDDNERINKTDFFSDEGVIFFLALEQYMVNKTLEFELYDSTGKKANSKIAFVNLNETQGDYVMPFFINNFQDYLPNLKSGKNNFTARYVLRDETRSRVIKAFPIVITKLGGNEDLAEIQQLRN